MNAPDITAPDNDPGSEEDQSNIFSRISLSWLSRILSIGYARTLSSEDIGALPRRHRNPRLPVPRAHNDTLERRVFRFALANGLLWNAVLMLVADISTYLTPALQSQLLALIEKRADGAILTTYDYSQGTLVCVGMFVLQCINNISINQYFFRSMALGMELRAAIQTELYERLLAMPAGSGSCQAGHLINLITNDASRLDLAVPFLHYWWSNPMQCCLVAGLLYRYVGWAGLVGAALLIVFVPLQSIGAAAMAKRRRSAAHHADCRLRLLQELLSGIKTVKLKSWESIFLDDLAAFRRSEQHELAVAQYIRSSISMISVTLPLFAFLLTMVMYHVVMKQPVSMSVTITVIAYFNLLRQPLSLIPLVAASTSDGRAALHRLSSFFSIPLSSPSVLTSTGIHQEPSHPAIISIESAVFRWSPSADGFVLYVPDLTITRGELIVITGPVGSGKTSLLMAILGEMPIAKGSVLMHQSITALPYASSQYPWILNMTIRDNIVFVSPFDPDIYQQVIDSCQLEEDLERLADGDSTMIGERGANLSGGQKTRVSLARACYHALINAKASDISSNDVVLVLDEPTGSVDARVSKTIARDCIGDSLDGITRVVVSSHPVLLQQATRVLVIDESGNVRISQRQSSTYLSSTPSVTSDEPAIEASLDKASTRRDELQSTAIQTDKGSDATGTIQSRVFSKYLEMAGGIFLYALPILVLASAQQATRTMSDITASNWARVKSSAESSWYISAFTAYALAHGVSFFLNAHVFIAGGRRAGKQMHQDAVSSILYAPLIWTSSQSPGRLTNRLSSDMETVDYNLPESLRSSVVVFANVNATFILLIIHNYYNAVFVVAVSFFLYGCLQYYRSSSREVGRLVAMAKGPLQGLFLESSNGLVYIRAFRAASNFTRRCHQLIDSCNRPYYVQVALQRWLELRVTMAGNAVILLAALSTLFVPGPLALTAATMNKTLTVTRVMNWLVRRVADAELQFISVERLTLLTTETVKEPVSPMHQLLPQPPPDNAEIGMKVEFRNVSARYSTASANDKDRKLETRALHNVSFSVAPGERIGIVGRTGSGKSTLILSLFRAIEPLEDSRILLDGIDTHSMALATVRRQIAVIPQDPFIFSATIRRNLDPGKQYPDDALWQALDTAGLRPAIADLSGGLDHLISPSELSAGHRQLLAMARIILSRPRLLVMDEATASLDQEGEERVLAVLKDALPCCTVLSVAHRIPAVMQCARVIVLDAGCIVEEGAPELLLDDPGSRFAQLAAHHFEK